MNKKPFADRHPVLNAIFGLLLLLAFVFVAIKLLKCGFIYIGNCIEKLKAVASDLDKVVIVALITGAVSIIGVIISSIIAKIIEYRKSRQEYLARKREEPYGAFIDMVYRIQENVRVEDSYSEEEMTEDIMAFNKQLTLWGSPKVVNKWIEFKANGVTPQKAIENMFVLEEIMNQMRKDLGSKKTKKGNLLGFFVNDINEYIK